LPTLRSRVRSPSLTPGPSSPTGRGAAFRARRFRVRIPGGARTQGALAQRLRQRPAKAYTGRPVRRFESFMLRSRMADRVGKVPGRKPEVTARAVGRFESYAIRCEYRYCPSVALRCPSAIRRYSLRGRASRVSDDGSGFENRRASRPCGFEPRSFRSGCAIRLATEPALKPGELHSLAGPTPAASAEGSYPTGEGVRLMSG
jgi:hypothetical protein